MRITCFLSLSILFYLHAVAQTDDLVGLWEFVEVKVGDELMTPQAKWTRINEDGTYQSGNGWLQNSEGQWSYNGQDKLFRPREKNGMEDPFGPFTVWFEEKTMKWQRQEEGMSVIVSLQRISSLPKAPADQWLGLWKREHVAGDTTGVSMDDYLLIRWDRWYMNYSVDGAKSMGYWHAHGHRPEVSFIPQGSGTKPHSWRIEVTETKLILEGLSEANKGLRLSFTRSQTFPK